MKKIYFITAAAFLGAVAWSAAAFFAPHGHIAEVVQAGKTIARIDLSAEKGSRTVTVASPGGGVNVLLIEKGKIRVQSADCPGQDCVKMGWLRSSSLPLVCLPHRLSVRFAQGSGGELDSVAQ